MFEWTGNRFYLCAATGAGTAPAGRVERRQIAFGRLLGGRSPLPLLGRRPDCAGDRCRSELLPVTAGTGPVETHPRSDEPGRLKAKFPGTATSYFRECSPGYALRGRRNYAARTGRTALTEACSRFSGK